MNKAIYVSVWDNNVRLTSKCTIDPETKLISDIGMIDVSEVKEMKEQFIEMPNGHKVVDFLFADEEQFSLS